MTRALIGASALLLAGCSMTPAYERPAPPVPATLPQGEAYAAPAAGETAGLAWTELVQDARLRTVIERALANNRDLRAAIANVQSARAISRAARGAAADGDGRRGRQPDAAE